MENTDQNTIYGSAIIHILENMTERDELEASFEEEDLHQDIDSKKGSCHQDIDSKKGSCHQDLRNIDSMIWKLKKDLADLEIHLHDNLSSLNLYNRSILERDISHLKISALELQIEKESQKKMQIEINIANMEEGLCHLKIAELENGVSWKKRERWVSWCYFIGPTGLDPLRAKYAMMKIPGHPCSRFHSTGIMAAECFVALYLESANVSGEELLKVAFKKFYHRDNFTCNKSEICFLYLNKDHECGASGLFVSKEGGLMVSKLRQHPEMIGPEICLQHYDWTVHSISKVERVEEEIHNFSDFKKERKVFVKVIRGASLKDPELIKMGSSVAMYRGSGIENRKYNEDVNGYNNCAIVTTCPYHQNSLMRIGQKIPSLEEAFKNYEIC
jgi:hypothetical protein